ncbi:MAG TPA: Asp-tRNA(Asn)/Glu-tRNA(Gln) amidotransferase subunit GatC [Syntrophales bacterium]|nr:Asp-tRNA(Asn)/Glu-tRNA(Gln) amidotransferase subunit GatC [Syntrophales bacterium]
MKIEKEEVKYVAHLARLYFNEEETETFTSQLNDILLYMDKLNEVDTVGVKPVSHAIALTNAFREDIGREPLGHDLALANAPEARGGFFVVPRVVE